jgi:hypothetical protein
MSVEPSDAHWAVALEGNELVLEEACLLFGRDGDVRVCRFPVSGSDTRVVLIAKKFENLADDGRVYELAKRIVDLVNGILFVEDPSRAPIRLQGVVHRRADNGQWGVNIFVGSIDMNGGGRMRAALTVGDGVPPVPQQTVWLRQAMTDGDVLADVLTFLRGSPDWADLYKAFDQMQKDIGAQLGKRPASEMGWPGTTNATFKHFKQSTQVYRHSRPWPPGYDVETAMTLSEARKYVQGLARLWLNWRSK